jgi:hypothetical protein
VTRCHGSCLLVRAEPSCSDSSLPVPPICCQTPAALSERRRSLVGTTVDVHATCWQAPGALGKGDASSVDARGTRRGPQASAIGEASIVKAAVELDRPATPPVTTTPIQAFRAALRAHVQNSTQGQVAPEATRRLAVLQVKAQEYAARLDMTSWQRSRKDAGGRGAKGPPTRSKAAEACQEGGIRSAGDGMSAAWVVRSIVSQRRIEHFVSQLRKQAALSRPEDQHSYHLLVRDSLVATYSESAGRYCSVSGVRTVIKGLTVVLFKSICYCRCRNM